MDCQTAEWCEITLQPFEVLSFDVMVANGAGTFEFGAYQEWRDQQAAEARDTAQDFLGSWTDAYQGHQFTRSFLPDGSATLAIDGEIWSGWSGRRWHIDDGNLVVTASGAEPETHRINHRSHLVLPAGLGFTVRQRRE